ncbi:MAG TPA: hypothetical protein VGQ90_15495 [Stellaceae bacterium]|jgi:membrane protein implicated in regulation of membrane protease activity|nr:hypothetical protein [Stellaceae bacterium]
MNHIIIPPSAQMELSASVPVIRTMGEFLQMNWTLIAFWVAIQIAGIAASYFTNRWESVGLSVVVAVVTSYLGYRAIQRVIRPVALS